MLRSNRLARGHFFFTSLAEKGEPVHVRAALVGPNNISIIAVDLHANTTFLKVAVELVGGIDLLEFLHL